MFTNIKKIAAYLFITGIFSAVVYFINEDANKERATLTWPSVMGVITHSKVASEYSRDSDGRTTKMYYPNIKYDYAVNGVDYKGDKYELKVTKSSPDTFARNIVNEFKLGKAVPVYYNPANPSIAILSPGVSFMTSLFLYVFGFIVLCLWSYLIFRVYKFVENKKQSSVRTI